MSECTTSPLLLLARDFNAVRLDNLWPLSEYRVIHKSLRDFLRLRYSNRDGDAEGEHVNRGRETPIFCATLQVLDMSTLSDAADVKFGNFGRF
jgi:hypothetical protein